MDRSEKKERKKCDWAGEKLNQVKDLEKGWLVLKEPCNLLICRYLIKYETDQYIIRSNDFYTIAALVCL